MKSEIINIFDIKQIIKHRNRAAKNFKNFSFLKELFVNRLIERISEINREFLEILDLGCHDGHFAKSLILNEKLNLETKLVQADYSSKFLKEAKKYGKTILLKNENLPFKKTSFDMICSSLFLHWINDLPGMLKQINMLLKPGGVFLAAVPGGNTLIELRNSIIEAETKMFGGTSQRFSPMLEIKDLGRLLQRAGFDLPVVDAEQIKVDYKDIFSLMRDIKGMGEQNAMFIRPKNLTTKKLFNKSNEIYYKYFFSKEKNIIASIEIIFLIGWKKESI